MKKFLSVLLTTAILSSMPISALADTATYSEWAKDSIEKAISLDIISENNSIDYTKAITREKFCELVFDYCFKNYFKNYTTEEISSYYETNNHFSHHFSDTDNYKILILSGIGIIQGKSDTEFAPDDTLTREEAATILNRVIYKMYPIFHTDLFFEFDDSSQISDWAMDSVQIMCNLGIMNGVGDNNFAPQDTYTTEQAIATIMRLDAAINTPEEELEPSEITVSAPETFADKLNAQMPEDKNYMFSPFSIKMALMMAANGADGETLDEILTATGVSDVASYNDAAKDTLKKYSQSDILRLNVSNSIWINTDQTKQRFSKNFETTVKNSLNAESGTVTNDTAPDTINGWVNEKTEGKIPEIITEANSDFHAMLINAVYFKARWQDEFYPGNTEKDIFTSKNGKETSIDFMNATGYLYSARVNGVKIVELPYLNREDIFDENGKYVETKKSENLSMYLMMSDYDFNAEEILANVDLSSNYIALSVPKFEIEYNTELNNILKTLGINKAFGKNAEFEKMFNYDSMWIDSSIHKTYIKVDEEGTEAAAVTSFDMVGGALPPKPIELKFNKPFTFVIKDNTSGEILFIGEYAFAE